MQLYGGDGAARLGVGETTKRGGGWIVERDVTQLTSLIANMAMGIEDRVPLSRSAWIHNMPRALIPP